MVGHESGAGPPGKQGPKGPKGDDGKLNNVRSAYQHFDVTANFPFYRSMVLLDHPEAQAKTDQKVQLAHQARTATLDRKASQEILAMPASPVRRPNPAVQARLATKVHPVVTAVATIVHHRARRQVIRNELYFDFSRDTFLVVFNFIFMFLLKLLVANFHSKQILLPFEFAYVCHLWALGMTDYAFVKIIDISISIRLLKRSRFWNPAAGKGNSIVQEG